MQSSQFIVQRVRADMLERPCPEWKVLVAHLAAAQGVQLSEAQQIRAARALEGLAVRAGWAAPSTMGPAHG